MRTMLVVSFVEQHDIDVKYLYCIINDYIYLDKVRQRIKDFYGIEFEELPRHVDCDIKLNNITDNRDVHLLIKRIPVVE